MQTVQSACLTAAFMMEGLRDLESHPMAREVNVSEDDSKLTSYDAVIDAWGHGCLELIRDMTQYVQLSEQLLDCAGEADFPGVYDYEVSNAFGQWFGYRVLANRRPDRIAAAAVFTALAYAFFWQGNDATTGALRERFNGVFARFIGRDEADFLREADTCGFSSDAVFAVGALCSEPRPLDVRSSEQHNAKARVATPG
ncbi:MAG: hypothetical protein QM803_09920 [Rhodocyclaceae bacterium]